MTELEIMERARRYLDQLANGINPLDGQEVPAGEILNNVRISRCLFYVSDVLRQVIENGGIQAPVREKKPDLLPFSLTLDQRNRCEFTEEAVTVTVLTQRINALIDGDTMKPVKYTQITDWLVDTGMLEVFTTAENRHVKRASALGEGMGIRNEERMGQTGPYTAVVYTLSAQHFIVDNLEAILALSAQRVRNEGSPWSMEENEQLRDWFHQGLSPEDMALKVGRKPGSVKRQLKKIGL